MEYRIGCSGFYYPQWKDKLYPKGLASKDWLKHYNSVFNTVELNGTFYRQPKLADLKKYASVTTGDFTFSVKMSRYISHVQRLKDKPTIEKFQSLILEGLEHKLQHFLFQMPPNYHYSEENLQTLIENIPHSPQNVVEFRHASWWNNEVETALRSASITFCNIDFPGIKSPFISTTGLFYLRLHGNPELFKTPYTKRKLKSFYNKFPTDARICTVYFNNTVTDAGFENALELKKITSPSQQHVPV